MHRPGGYLVGYGQSGLVCESDTFTCSHCNHIVACGRHRGADVGGFCRCCTRLICGACVDKGGCAPFEKKLEAMERRADVLRSYGMEIPK